MEIINEKEPVNKKNNSDKNSVNDSFSVERKSSIKSEDDLKKMIEKDKHLCLRDFLSFLESEIRKIYIFYTNCERDLYVMINSHLYKRKVYKYSFFYP